MEILGHTLTMLGEVMIGFTAIAVHHRFLREHKVDDKVFRTMRREQVIGVLGVVLVVVGYLSQIFSKVS